MNYSIVPSHIAHVYELSATMREADASEAKALGYDPKRLLRSSFRSSLYARTAFIETNIAAMWGLTGDILSEIGMPWLVTAPIIETKPIAFLRESRRELEAMLRFKPILENYVDARYHKAIRLLEMLGFGLDPPAPRGRKGSMFRRFSVER